MTGKKRWAAGKGQSGAGGDIGRTKTLEGSNGNVEWAVKDETEKDLVEQKCRKDNELNYGKRGTRGKPGKNLGKQAIKKQ